MRRAIVALLACVALAGCYHATVDTSPAPAGGVTQQAAAMPGQIVTIPWANGFVYGLVPPPTVDAKGKCPKGVVKVETQLSFLNMLASNLTLGLYTPMTIKVTCAA